MRKNNWNLLFIHTIVTFILTWNWLAKHTFTFNNKHFTIIFSVWLTYDNKIESLSKTGNETITIEDGRHVLGLSNHVSNVPEKSWSVFITELGISGPSVYQISGKHLIWQSIHKIEHRIFVSLFVPIISSRYSCVTCNLHE